MIRLITVKTLNEVEIFLSDLYANIEKHDVFVYKITIKNKEDYNLVKQLLQKNEICWGVSPTNIKHDPNLQDDFWVEADEKYNISTFGNFIKVTEEEKKQDRKFEKRIARLQSLLYFTEQKHRTFLDSICKKYNKEVRKPRL